MAADNIVQYGAHHIKKPAELAKDTSNVMEWRKSRGLSNVISAGESAAPHGSDAVFAASCWGCERNI